MGPSARSWLTSFLALPPQYKKKKKREGRREGKKEEGKREEGREAFNLQMGRNPNGKELLEKQSVCEAIVHHTPLCS